MDKEPINANAEYLLVIPYGNNSHSGSHILVDMFDIDDIQYMQDVKILKEGIPQNNIHNFYEENNFETKKLYSLFFKDGIGWSVFIDRDGMEIFKKHKEKRSKNKEGF